MVPNIPIIVVVIPVVIVVIILVVTALVYLGTYARALQCNIDSRQCVDNPFRVSVVGESALHKSPYKIGKCSRYDVVPHGVHKPHLETNTHLMFLEMY